MTLTEVKSSVEQAARTLSQLPLGPGEKPMGVRSSWPGFSQAADSLQDQYKKLKYIPKPEDIDKMNLIFDALICLSASDRVLIWSRACRIPWRRLQMRFGWSRAHAHRRHQIALLRLADILDK